MKLLFIAMLLFTITTAATKSTHNILHINGQKNICDTVPYPSSNKQPIDQNPVNGNGTPLNNTNPQPQPVIGTNTYPTDTAVFRKADTSRKPY